MSCIQGLAKLRAATTVGDFNFTNNGAPLTSLPTIITALNGSYTRNSVKNVVQNGALVSLSANQFGTSYDPVAATYGYVPEPAATNLCTNSDGNASTYNTADQVTDGTAVPGFTNGIYFGNNSIQRRATKFVSMTTGTVYSVSLFIIMDDGGAPVVGSSITTGDFCIIAANNIASPTLTRLIGSNVYRISGSSTATATALLSGGIIKYTGQSARTFRVTGIQVETGNRATSYIATTGSTASRSADVLTVPLWVNNVKDSQDGSTANWNRTNCTCVTSGTAPDGTATAQLLTTSSTAVTTFYNASCRAPAGTIAATVYIKKGNTTSAGLRVRNDTTSTILSSATVDLDAGTISGTGWTISNEGSGWYRCKYTTASGVTVGDTLRLYVAHVGNTSANGSTYYFWGAQIEAGSVATTYKPTTSTLESTANANITGFSSAGYTLFVDGRFDVQTSTERGLVSVDDSTANNRAQIRQNASNQVATAVVSGGVAQASNSQTSVGVARYRAAYSVSANSFMRAVNGVAGTADTAGSVPVSPTTLQLGKNHATDYGNGFIFNAKLIPLALTQAQLNGLTT